MWPRQAVSGEHCPRHIRIGTRCTAHTSSGRENGTWEQIAARLAAAVRVREGRDAEPSAGIVDARSVHAGATVSKETKGYDAEKRINGRKTFGIVDTLGLLMAVVVVAASTSDNTGGMSVSDRERERSACFARLWCDSGFKRTFIEHCRNHHIGVEVVKRIHPGFKVSQALDRGTHLGLADEQSASPGRLRAGPGRHRGLHLGCP